MKNKTLRKILAFVMLTILIVQFALTIVVFAKDEESIRYSNVMDDLKKTTAFKQADYPRLSSSDKNYYSLQVITVAESEKDELFVYVYQPSGQTAKIEAASIDISTTERNDEKEFSNYKLSLVNSYDVYFKYKVEDFKVSKDEIRYYEISDILRPWSKNYGDSDPDAGNTVSEVAYPVGKFFTFVGESMQKVEDIEYVEIENQYIGFVRVEQDVPFTFVNPNERYFDSFFVAFSTKNISMDNILEVSISFEETFFYAIGFRQENSTIKLQSKQDKKISINFEDKLYLDLADGNFSYKQEFIRDRIQNTSDFLSQNLNYSYFGVFNNNEPIDYDDAALEKLNQTQWVISFAEKPYFLDNIDFPPTCSYYRLSDIKVMRLKFEINGQIYNLGVVSNKQTGSDDPAAVVESTDWWQKIMLVIMLIFLMVALMFIWPIISPVVKIIWQGIKGIFKFLIWILMLPSRLFRKIFKLSDRRSDQRRKERKSKK